MLEMIRRRKKEDETLRKLVAELTEISRSQKATVKQLEELNKELKKIGRGK